MRRVRTAAAVGCVMVLSVATVVGVRLLSDGDGRTGPRSPGAAQLTPGPVRQPAQQIRARPGVTTNPAEQVLRPGQRPPQFVVVSFDGVGWHRMWKHWFAVAATVPFTFTGFLSGTYLLSEATKNDYHPPHLPRGSSAIGWGEPADVPVEIRDLNRAHAAGDEIGTHFNGHFCAGFGFPTDGASWNSADWDHELDQFFDLLRGVGRNNHLTHGPRLQVSAADIRGERTPCLEGTPAAVYPALRDHGMDYDASFTRPGLAWPTEDHGIWQLGMATFPVHGTLPDGRVGVPVTMMDYNYYFTQRGASDTGLTATQSRSDGRQVLDTYRDAFHAAYAGNRAPLILGNHFNDWNHDAYRNALTTFVEQTCGRPHTECVSFGQLVDWLQAQRPSVLRHLEGLPAETGPRGVS